MPNHIIRIRLRDALPCQRLRDQTLRKNFGADAVIHEFTPPENPGNLFQELGDKVFAVGAVAIELDTRDRILAVLLGAAAWMGALNAPVLYPTFSATRGTIVDSYPQVFEGTDDVLVAPDARFSGYVELCDAKAVTKPANNLVI